MLIANLEASAPPLRDQVTVSLAVKVWIAVVFSLMDLLLVASPALPDGPVIFAPSSSTSTTAMVTVCSLLWNHMTEKTS